MQMQYLAATLGHHAVAGPTLLRPDGHYGNALLTRRPVLDVRHVDLTVYRREPRAALDVDLDIDGVAVRVIVTHLGLLPGERRTQVAPAARSAGREPRGRWSILLRRHQRMVRGRAAAALAARAPRTDREPSPPSPPRFRCSRSIASGCTRAAPLTALAAHASPSARAGLRSPAGDGGHPAGSAALARMPMPLPRGSLRARWCCRRRPVCSASRRARAQQADEAIPGSATTRRCTSGPAPRWRWSATPGASLATDHRPTRVGRRGVVRARRRDRQGGLGSEPATATPRGAISPGMSSARPQACWSPTRSTGRSAVYGDRRRPGQSRRCRS